MWYDILHYRDYEAVKDKAPKFIRPEKVEIETVCEITPYQEDMIRSIRDRYALLQDDSPSVFYSREEKDLCLLKKVKNKYHRLLHPITTEPMIDLNAIKSWNAIAKYHNDKLKGKTEIDTPLELKWRSDSAIQGYYRKKKPLPELKPHSIQDNYLVLFHDAKLIAIAPQLLNFSRRNYQPNPPISKQQTLWAAVDNICEEWLKSRSFSGTQLVFCDVGTPGGSASFPLYEWVKEQVVKKLKPHGFQPEQFDWVSGKTTKRRDELFAKIRTGEVSICMGHTTSLGIGVDVQDRITALHLLDVPDRPDQDEQRIRRAIRSGNMNKEVRIYRYITKGSANELEYNVLAQKIATRSATLTSKTHDLHMVRELQEVDESETRFLVLQGMSCPLEIIGDFNQVKRDLKVAKNAVINAEIEMRKLQDERKSNSIAGLKRTIDIAQASYVKVAQDLKTIRDNDFPDGVKFIMRVGDEDYTVKKHATEAIEKEAIALMKQVEEKQHSLHDFQIGEYRGLQIQLSSIYCGDEGSVAFFKLKLVGADEYPVTFGFNSSVRNLVKEVDSILENNKVEEFEQHIAATKAKLIESRDRAIQLQNELPILQETQKELEREEARLTKIIYNRS